jgi:arylsulfatase A-like enzyme
MRPRVTRWLLVLFVAVACGRDDRDVGPAGAMRDVVWDLLSSFAASVHQPPTQRIDVADPAHLLHGWSAAETRPDGTAGVHLLEPIGAITFAAGATPVDRTITVRASSTRAPTVVEVNGQRIGRLSLRRVAPDVVLTTTLHMPAAVQRPGPNTLTLRTAQRRRHRGLVLHGVELSGVPIDALATYDDAAGVLVLQPGADIELFARAPADARLHLDASGGDARLAVSVTPDGGVEGPVSLTPSGAALGVPADGVFRLRLAVPADGAAVRVARLDVAGRAAAAPRPEVAGERANVLLYVADTLRADRLGAYGYGAGTSPHLDALARDGVLFTRAVAASSWTRPSTATLVTGLSPSDHGALGLHDPIRPGAPRLAAAFRAAGHRTAGFVTNVNVADRFGFGEGFDHYAYLPEDPDRRGVHTPAAELHAAALAWLDEQPDAPFFLYLHATDTHAPYAPKPELAARFVPPGLAPAFGPDVALAQIVAQIGDDPERVTPDDVRDLSGRYDAEIAGLDADFGRLVEALRARGLWDRLLVVFVADHGEEFREHGGFEHGRTLHREVTDVPLVIRLPRGAGGGRRVTDLARHLDVAPTVLAAAGLAAPESLPGRVLVGPDGQPASAPASEATAETHLSRRRLQALVTADAKVIVDGRDGRVQVFDLAADPGEATDRAAERPVLAGYARQVFAATRDPAAWAGAQRAAPAPLDAATAARLRALGYLHE